jgi:MYXO-CTERM domain-containing protein
MFHPVTRRARCGWWARFAAVVAVLLTACSPPAAGPGDVEKVTGALSVLTRNYGVQRSGANVNETILNTTNVNTARFARLFQVSVDDDVYASILITPGLSIQGGARDVFFVATVNNSVYAFDADAGGAPLWQRNFNGAGRPTNPVEVGQACDLYRNYRTHIGLVGTPVIDPATQTMYFVTRTVEGTATVQRLNALDITTGNPRAASPVVIAGDVAGTGAGSSGGRLAFDPLLHNQRAALAISGGAVHVAWGSFCDTGPYHGWAMAFDATTLARLGVFNTTTGGGGSGIWMGGAGPAIDGAGNLFFTTGNGSFDGAANFSETLLKLAPGTLARLDFFTPTNYSTLDANDADLGSAGPIFLPGTSVLAAGGKQGKLYLLDAANLGGGVGDQHATQAFQAVDVNVRPNATHHIHNGTVAWQGPDGISVYVWGENDYPRRFHYDPASRTLGLPAASVGTVLPPVGMPGGMLTLSASGSTAGTGILWATTPREGDANDFTVPGVLSAFNAQTMALLWQSTRAEDDPLMFAKFNPPVVANGRVYVASFSKVVSVYGLRGTPVPPPPPDAGAPDAPVAPPPPPPVRDAAAPDKAPPHDAPAATPDARVTVDAPAITPDATVTPDATATLADAATTGEDAPGVEAEGPQDPARSPLVPDDAGAAPPDTPAADAARRSDTASAADAGFPGETGGGCSCSLEGSSPPSTGLTVLPALGLAFVAMLRRKRGPRNF